MWPILLLSIGLGAGYYAGQGAASTTSSAANWPPTAAQLQALQSQMNALVMAVTARTQPLDATQLANLQNILTNAPNVYLSTLPAGAAPSVADFEAWLLSGSANGATAVFSQLVTAAAASSAYPGAGVDPTAASAANPTMYPMSSGSSLTAAGTVGYPCPVPGFY